MCVWNEEGSQGVTQGNWNIAKMEPQSKKGLQAEPFYARGLKLDTKRQPTYRQNGTKGDKWEN